MRRVVQKRAEDADKRRREAKAKSEDNLLAEGERAILEKKKAEDKERLAREAKARLKKMSASVVLGVEYATEHASNETHTCFVL